MVFSLSGGRRGGSPTGGAFRGPAEVRAYWEALRRDGALPCRADLDPRGMRDVLDRVFVAERIGPGLLRLRIAGTALTELAGIEMRGLPLSALFLPEARDRLADVAERALTRPGIAGMQLEAAPGIGRPALAGRLLLLPLCSSPGVCDLMLGCLATSDEVGGKVGRAPRRFAITRVDEEGLDLPAPPPAPALRTRAHLRLVHSA